MLRTLQKISSASERFALKLLLNNLPPRKDGIVSDYTIDLYTPKDLDFCQGLCMVDK